MKFYENIQKLKIFEKTTFVIHTKQFNKFEELYKYIDTMTVIIS